LEGKEVLINVNDQTLSIIKFHVIGGELGRKSYEHYFSVDGLGNYYRGTNLSGKCE